MKENIAKGVNSNKQQVDDSVRENVRDRKDTETDENESDLDGSKNDKREENESASKEIPMPTVGSSSKPVVRRSRSSLTVVSRGSDTLPIANMTNVIRYLNNSDQNEG